ncbi:MAG: exonuclease subunit SbcD [Clostridiales bacterium]|nr:exonuclease subunit SbcD [Clostridiales bacterium]
MKILHTADLHLGKRLGKASRLDEQCDVIRELVRVCDEQSVDVVLIAGDIFDTVVPTSRAERVFYQGVTALASRGRAVIALAGNHDDDKRLSAASPLAESQGIVLAGELDYSALGSETLDEPVPPASLFEVAAAADFLKKQRIKIVGKKGGISVHKGDERVNVALVPYPSEARLKDWAEQDYSIDYEERVKNTIETACEIFEDGAYNILCTHLFLTKSAAEPLGGLEALPVSVLPENADYVALGHVHKRYTVTKKPLAVYAGSPLQYAYDESRNKSVTIIDTAARTVTEHLLKSGKKLTETDAYNFDDCMTKLEQYKDDYVRIRYGGEPLGKSDYAQIKEHPAFNDFVITAVRHESEKTERRAHLTDDEIFEQYYLKRYGVKPKSDVKAAFTALMNELKEKEL